LRFIHLLIILLTLAAYSCPLIDPHTFWPLATLGLLAPMLWLLVLIFGFYWLWKKDGAVWLSSITLLLGMNIITTAFAIPDGKVQYTAKPISIVSLNGHAFMDDNTKMAAYLASLKSDILCLQEFHKKRNKAGLIKQIKATTGLDHLYHDNNGGIAVFSRYPLKNGATHFFENRVNGYLAVDVESPDGVFRLFNLHLQTNAISRMANKVAKDVNLQDKKTWLTIKGMFGRYGRSSRIRSEQSRQIMAEVRGSPYPVFLCGDFNDVPASYLYGLYQEELQDAHLAQSWGLGATYAGVLPGLRIDYLMPDHAFDIINYKTFDCFFSDHRAICGEVVLQK